MTMKKKWFAAIMLIVMVGVITGCFQEASTKHLVPDDQDSITPDGTSQPTDEVIVEIDNYEGEDVDLEEFDDLTKDFEGL